MKANANKKVMLSATTVAVRGAIAAMMVCPALAMAQSDDPEVAALVNPTNSIEVGVGVNSKASDKFGEYNGQNKGGDFIGNFSVKGGDAYGQGTGTMRWGFSGTDLGTTSRELNGNVSDQGQWKIGIGYDEIQHNITNTYQTPYQGAMGGNNFILPPSFGVINVKQPAPAAAVPYGAQTLTANQVSDFTTPSVYTKRENTKFIAGYNFDTQWNFQFEFNHLDQSGAKLTAAGSDQVNSVSGAYPAKGEAPVILMTPTNYKTDMVTAAINWAGEKGHFTAGYYGSFFHDGYDGVNFSNPFINATVTGATKTGTNIGALPINTLSTAPNSQLNQLNLSGGYALSSTMKLQGGFSYGRNTSDQGFVDQYMALAGGLPNSSLNGVVKTTHADAKLTDQTTQDLKLSAGFTYNERNNDTPMALYKFYDVGGGTWASFNTPVSNRKTQIEFAADYRVVKGQDLHLAYDYEQVQRWCNDMPSYASLAASNISHLPIFSASYWSQASSCEQVPENKESKVLGNYRIKLDESVNVNLGASYGHRDAELNKAFYNAMQGAGGSTGFELPGMVAFFDSSRNETQIKGGVDWQATDRLSFDVTGRYSLDNYTDNTLGVQNGNNASLNFDSTLTTGEKSSINAYITLQARSLEFNNNKGAYTNVALSSQPATLLASPWSNELRENDVTLGVSAKQGGLLGGKLSLLEDLTGSVAQTSYNTNLNYAFVPTATAPSCAQSTSGAVCGSTPTISSRMWQVKLVGAYSLDKKSSVSVGYIYQNLRSNDYFYNAYQMGYNPTSVLPTNQQAPSYVENRIFASYKYSFQ